MRRLFSLILYHLLRPVTYDKMMQLENPLTDLLHSKSTRASEKKSINKITVGKLGTEEYYFRKLVISSERLAYLRKTTRLILHIVPT